MARREQAVIEINSDKLRKEIRKRGYTFIEAAKKMGFHDGFVHQILYRGTITKSCAKMIESVLGIPLCTYMKLKWEKVIPAEAKDVKSEQKGSIEQIVSELAEIKVLIRELVELWRQ